ncbi:terminase small subunit [Solibacillus silvestris]
MVNWEELKIEWETTDISLADLATKHDVKLGTLKSRKSREKWSKDATATDATGNQKDATISKVDATDAKAKTSKVKVRPELEKVVEAFSEVNEKNAELTDSQRFFCLYYVKYMNATKAYQKAYECSYETANTSGPRLMVNVRVRDEIARLKRERAAGIMLDGNDVLQKYMDIAFADIGDHVEYGTEEVELMDEGGLPLVDQNGDIRTYARSYVRFKNGAMLDNTVVSEIKQGKDGVSVKLHDKMKALDFLAKYTDLLDDLTKTQLQNEKTKVDAVNAALKQQQDSELHKLKLEQAKLNIKKSNAELDKINDPDADKNFTINFVRRGDV